MKEREGVGILISMRHFMIIVGLLFSLSAFASINVEEIYPGSTVQDEDVVIVKWSSTTSGDYRIEVGGNGTLGTGRLISSKSEGKVNRDVIMYTYLYPITDFTEGDGDYRVYIYVTEEGEEVPEYAVLNFTLDNVPEVPTGLNVAPGDGVLFINWDEHPDRDLDRFVIYWREGDNPVTSPSTDMYENYVEVDPNATSYTLSGLDNHTEYLVSIGVWDAGNKFSGLSPEVKGVPAKTFGVSHFANEEIGCVFTYYHPDGSYEILRNMKEIFKSTGYSRKLLGIYYHSISPYLINLSLKSDLISRISKIITFAFDDRIILGVVFMFLTILIFKKSSLFVILLVFIIPSELFAGSPRRFTFAVYGTNFYPSKFPEDFHWDDIYGKGGHFLLEGEFGIEVPTKGGVPGVSLQGGFFREKGYGLVEENGVYRRASKDHYFYFFPLRINLFYRFGYIEDQYVVPFVKGGVSFIFFMEQVVDGEVVEKGTVSGFHWSAGLLFSLDWLDKDHARKLDNTWGINQTFIWIEYAFQYVDNKRFPWGESTYYDFSSHNLYVGLGFDI